MYHPNRHDIIEMCDDIQDVESVHITNEGGQKVLFMKAVLDPRKDYQAQSEIHLHLTNGVNHRTLGPFAHAEPLQLSAPTKEEGAEEEMASTPATPETSEEISKPTTSRGKRGHA